MFLHRNAIISVNSMFKPSIIVNIALFVYFPIFLVLLKLHSFKLAKTWFVPLFALYFGVLFATLFAIFLNGNDSTFSSQDTFLSVALDLINPKNRRGKVLFGGYFGAIFGIGVANLLSRQKSLPAFLDISAISISFLFFVWRIGCFAGGCCYGEPNDTLGVSFSRKTTAFAHLKNTALVVNKATVPLLPTQLFSAAGDLIIFLFLLILFCKNKIKLPYFYFFAHAFLYGIGRFTIEFFRIDPREFWGPLSMSQWISLVLIAASLVFFIKNRKEIAESFKNKASHIR